MSESVTSDRITAILLQALQSAKQAKIDPATIKPETDFRSDLNLDSLSMMETVWEVEENLGIGIDTSELPSIKTVGDFMKMIERELGKKEGHAA